MAWVAEKLRKPFMPWQRLVVDVGMEQIPADDQTREVLRFQGVPEPDGGYMVPAYREVVVTVMRQSGKTTLVLAVECEQCMTPNSTVVYTAQSGVDGKEKYVDDQIPLLDASELAPKIRRHYRAAQNTGSVWRNGSLLKVLAVGESPGHGKTIDKAMLDETFKDKDDSREGALRPAMRTKPMAQFWNTSTAGTAESTFLLRKVELGRAAATADRRQGVAFFEWAIPEDEDVYDPRVWERYMPAYGITQTERILRVDAESMTEGEWRRTAGNQWTETEDRLIPADWWVRASKKGLHAGKQVYAIDARPDRSNEAVFRADSEANVELVAARPGDANSTSWIVGDFEEKVPTTARVVVDGRGPLAGVGDDLEKKGFQVVRLDSLAVRKSCARFYDALADSNIQIRSDERLDAASKAAARRSTSDSWAWHREAPGGELLMGLSLAYAEAVTETAWEPVAEWM